ncbi:unnamed protein product [Cyclocybe aegerita]|uniref:Uncharacterized protein n=1 Tax=Cyclocybe aegerita TaxID=1973307 RepID=A0A8S0VS24_CYCAE|nr:unnamed protein product [Cyclocybe aegerita]
MTTIEQPDSQKIKEVLEYCESRFRTALAAFEKHDQRLHAWRTEVLKQELQVALRWIGVATATGCPVTVPSTIRSLASSLYFQTGTPEFDPISDSDPNPVDSHPFAWWMGSERPESGAFLTDINLQTCLNAWNDTHPRPSVEEPTTPMDVDCPKCQYYKGLLRTAEIGQIEGQQRAQGLEATLDKDAIRAEVGSDDDESMRDATSAANELLYEARIDADALSQPPRPPIAPPAPAHRMAEDDPIDTSSSYKAAPFEPAQQHAPLNRWAQRDEEIDGTLDVSSSDEDVPLEPAQRHAPLNRWAQRDEEIDGTLDKHGAKSGGRSGLYIPASSKPAIKMTSVPNPRVVAGQAVPPNQAAQGHHQLVCYMQGQAPQIPQNATVYVFNITVPAAAPPNNPQVAAEGGPPDEDVPEEEEPPKRRGYATSCAQCRYHKPSAKKEEYRLAIIVMKRGKRQVIGAQPSKHGLKEERSP